MGGRKQKRYRLDRIVPVGFIGAGLRFAGVLINISPTGMLVKCDVKVEAGAMLRAGIEMGTEVIRAAVVAKRCVEGVGVGFEFLSMGPSDNQKLHHLLMRIAKPR